MIASGSQAQVDTEKFLICPPSRNDNSDNKLWFGEEKVEFGNKKLLLKSDLGQKWNGK